MATLLLTASVSAGVLESSSLAQMLLRFALLCSLIRCFNCAGRGLQGLLQEMLDATRAYLRVTFTNGLRKLGFLLKYCSMLSSLAMKYVDQVIMRLKVAINTFIRGCCLTLLLVMALLLIQMVLVVMMTPN